MLKKFNIRKGALLAFLICLTGPVGAADMGLSLDEFINRVTASAEAADEKMQISALGCQENPKPGEPTATIQSCTHMLGGGRLLIANSDVGGNLLDIATQPWASEAEGPGSQMITWIAAAVNQNAPGDHEDAASTLVNAATTEGFGSATLGNVAFVVMDLGGSLTITAMAE